MITKEKKTIKLFDYSVPHSRRLYLWENVFHRVIA